MGWDGDVYYDIGVDCLNSIHFPRFLNGCRQFKQPMEKDHWKTLFNSIVNTKITMVYVIPDLTFTISVSSKSYTCIKFERYMCNHKDVISKAKVQVWSHAANRARSYRYACTCTRTRV